MLELQIDSCTGYKENLYAFYIRVPVLMYACLSVVLMCMCIDFGMK